MSRLPLFCLFAALITLIACSAGEEGANVSEASTEVVASDWRTQRYETGKAIFEASCAKCHDNTGDAAPRIGDQDSWTDRSPLWSAVLFEHAKNGYLDMPAKGGDSALSGDDVEAAGEYMLSETFPDLPRD